MKKKNPGGRPTKFTEQIKSEILGYIENGNSYTDACILAGVSLSTFMEWKAKGHKARDKNIIDRFSEFLERLDRAKIKYKAWLIQNVNNSAKKDGKLALEVLSRKWPREYAKKDFLHIDGKLDIMKFDVPIPEKERKEANENLKLFLRSEE